MAGVTVLEDTTKEPYEETPELALTPEQVLEAELPFMEDCLNSIIGRGPIICPACGSETQKDGVGLDWNIHWTLSHPELKQQLIEAGVEWMKGGQG